MEAKFNFIHYNSAKYQLNIESNRYEKETELIPFAKLPNELKVEKTIEQKIISQGANEIITGRVKNGKRTFFTGLRPEIKNFFSGNDYEYIKGQKKNSICVFQFSEDFKTLIVYYFNQYYKDSFVQREKFIRAFIEFLKGKVI